MNSQKKIINWLIIILFAAIDLIVIPIVFFELFPNEKDAGGAILTFAGAIIGGALTLLGVRATIISDQKKNRLNKLPKDVNNIWKVRKAIIELEVIVEKFKNNNQLISDLLTKFYDKNEEWVTELSAEIDAITYNIINSIFTHITDFHAYSSKQRIEIWYQEFDRLTHDLSSRVSTIEKEYEKLTDEMIRDTSPDLQKQKRNK